MQMQRRPVVIRHEGAGQLADTVEAFRLLGGAHASLQTATLPLGTVRIVQARSTGHDITAIEPERFVILLPSAGHLSTVTAGQTLSIGAGGAIFVRPGRRTTRVRPTTQGTFRGVGLIAQLHQGRDGRRSDAPSMAFSSVAGQPAIHALKGFLTYLVAEDSRPGSPVFSPAGIKAAEAFILNLMSEIDLLGQEPGARLIATSEAHVRRAEEIIQAHSDEPLTLKGLAQEIGIGLRALQLAFRIRRGMTPREALALARLNRARERLLAASPAETVASIAEISGCAHLGRFAGAYRERFGETPSDTLRRAKT